MAITLEAEVRKILNVANVPAAEINVVSCNPGDPSRLDDDSCVLETASQEALVSQETEDSGRPRKEVRVDDVFTLANSWNLGVGNAPDLDVRNYFFRLDPNVVFFRRGSSPGSDFADGGLLYRPAGTAEWRRLDFTDIQASPELRAAIVPILARTVQSRIAYDRLNGSPHHEHDYEYARAKAQLWLSNFTPVTPAPSPDAQSSDTVIVPSFTWESLGSAYIPWDGTRVGGYAEVSAGVQICIDSASECAQARGARVGFSAVGGRMVNGAGLFFFGGKVSGGNENWIGFLDAGVNWYPTGGSTGDRSTSLGFGGGLRWIPVPSFPLGLEAGTRFNLTDPRHEGAAMLGIGIGQ